MITVYFNKILDVHSKMNNFALGNHMFQYALCRLVAHKNNYNFYISDVSVLKECFPKIDFGLIDGNTTNVYNDSDNQEFNPSVFNIPDFTHLNGYFQTEKYFEGYEELIKSWFEVEMSGEIKEIIAKYPVDDYCYVHIRGGDNKYGTNNWLIPKDYYLSAFEVVKKLNKNIKFVIVTDDVEFSKSLFPEIDVISNNLILDFKCLYFSRYNIISASTFSWWPAWLTDKDIIVAPNKWLNHNKNEINDFYPKDIFTKKFTYI